MRLKYVLSVVFFLGFTFFATGVAANMNQKTSELAGLQKKIKKISRKINNLSTKKNALIAELKKLEMRAGNSAVILKQIAAQIVSSNQMLMQNRQQIYATQQQISAQKRALAIQIKAAYEMGASEKIKFILNQQDPLHVSRMLVYYDFMNHARLSKINGVVTNLQYLQKLEAQRLKQTQLLEQQRLQKQLEHSVLMKTKSNREMLLVKIEKQFSASKKQLNRYITREKRLKSLISSLRQAMDEFPMNEGAVKEFVKLKGKLGWPVKGKIIKKFGSHRAGSTWDGVLIKAKSGVEVRAITRGRVVYADWLRGYGLLTIIEHGKGYMSLYAFNQSLYKTVGDWVEGGDVIASVGQSGGQSGAGLYFGIRKKGKPVNPVKWCRHMRHGKTR